jgi:hypothetical protein
LTEVSTNCPPVRGAAEASNESSVCRAMIK